MSLVGLLGLGLIVVTSLISDWLAVAMFFLTVGAVCVVGWRISSDARKELRSLARSTG